MLSDQKLLSVGNFDLRLHHLLILGILALSFSVSALIRSSPAEYGFELNEFDSFFNYRATEYIIDNGIDEYFKWNDSLSWYPYGRDVSATSQVMLHLTAASTYWVFGGNSSLYDFTIIFPLVFASLSSIVMFALVRVIGGTTAGLISSLFFSISLPILVRSPIGWFKSEPLGIFFGLLSVYLLLSAITSSNKKIAISKVLGAGIVTTFAISSWGGNQFFIIPLGAFFISLPFLRNDRNFLLWIIPLYTIATLVSSSPFERGIDFSSLGGIVLMGTTGFLVSCILIQKKSSNNATRNSLIFLVAFLIIGSSVFAIGLNSELLPSPTHRYMNAINPFLTTTDPLVDSVSEHATTTLEQSFLFHSVLMIFSGLGVWLIIKNFQNNNPNSLKKDMMSFALIFGIVGLYVSAAFVRLELFASLSVIILSSIGISVLAKEFFRPKSKPTIGNLLKIPFMAGIIFLLSVPLVYPPDSDVFSLYTVPPTILNGGTAYAISTNDWLDSLSWIKNNTPEDAVIASWWDYGYWIQTMGERATLADNSTTHTRIIQEIARILLNSPEESWHSLNEKGADYVLVFVAANKLTSGSAESLYTMSGGGGDESKKQWFMRIGELDESKFVHGDGTSGTPYFWEETLLGQMFPYSLLGYVNPNNIQHQSETYVPGMIAIYQKEVKFTADGDGPLKLVYASPGFYNEDAGPKLGVFIYEVNKDYVPTQE